MGGKETDVEMARALLEAERYARIEECQREITAAIEPILKKYRCAMSPAVVIRGGRLIESAIEIFTVD